MLFTPAQIQDLLDRRAIVDGFAGAASDESAVDQFYREACRAVERETAMRSRIEWGHYGSGYASYIDAWFFREESAWAVDSAADRRSWHGLVVLLSRLSPYFVFLEGQKSWHGSSSASYLPDFSLVDRFDTPAVAASAWQVQSVLERCGLVRLRASDLSAPLDPTIQVPTMLAEPGEYREFDALFYWDD